MFDQEDAVAYAQALVTLFGDEHPETRDWLKRSHTFSGEMESSDLLTAPSISPPLSVMTTPDPHPIPVPSPQSATAQSPLPSTSNRKTPTRGRGQTSGQASQNTSGPGPTGHGSNRVSTPRTAHRMSCPLWARAYSGTTSDWVAQHTSGYGLSWAGEQQLIDLVSRNINQKVSCDTTGGALRLTTKYIQGYPEVRLVLYVPKEMPPAAVLLEIEQRGKGARRFEIGPQELTRQNIAKLLDFISQ